jgi:hypothetical protein
VSGRIQSLFKAKNERLGQQSKYAEIVKGKEERNMHTDDG